jgi:hypothetical protein
LPSYVIELQFGASAYIDVTQYVESVSINRGINRVLDDFSAGSLSITFVNNSRVFDPLNTSSPLWYGAGGYTLVQPAGNIRVSSNGVRRFTGFVQDWDFTFADSGFDGQATLTALDFMYKVGNVSFLGGTQPVVQATSDRIESSLTANSIGSAVFGVDTIRGGHTLVGYDVNSAGDNLLSYIQNVARSEPADLFGDASGFLRMKDRSFTDYDWNNTNRYNLVSYPSTATVLEGNIVAGEPRSGWTLIGEESTAVAPVYPNNPIWRGGTVADPFVPADSFVGFVYQDYNPARYVKQAWNNNTNTYTFAGLIRGAVGNFDVSLFTLDANGQFLSAAASTSVSGASTAWIPFTVTKTESSTAIVGGLAAFVTATGSSAYVVYGDGFIIEPGTVSPNYFNGGYNPYAFSGSASTAYEVAWSGEKYESQSGLLTSVSTAISASTVSSFADANSQSVFGGTAIPFTDLQVVYGSEQLYNKVQVVGINTSAVAEDTALQASYGVRVYSQSDNLTTSQTKPAQIASAYLAEFKFPEYRAEQVTVALESLTTTQQTAVVNIELRDVVRVAFKPSNTGSIVDKYYQVLGISSNTDVERDSVTFSLASLENLPFTLDSLFLGILDTDTLA